MVRMYGTAGVRARRILKMAVQRSVKRESLNVKGFRGRAFGNPTLHLSRLTFHGPLERCENAAWEKARLGAPGLGG
jgi:hypothetical protein